MGWRSGFYAFVGENSPHTKNNKTISFWNNLLWEKIFEHSSVNGSGIDKYEFYDFCGYHCSKTDCDNIFNMINNHSRTILFSEFEDFLLHIDNKDYTNINYLFYIIKFL